MYTSPSVLQCARTVDIGLFRKTGWPARAWWLWSSTTTTTITTSLTNFTSLGVIRPENRGEIVSSYNLQWVVRIPESTLLLYSEKPTQANPNRKRLPTTVIAEQDRRFLLVRERGPAPQPARGGLRRVEVRQGGAGQGRCGNSEEGTERPQLAEQEGSP